MARNYAALPYEYIEEMAELDDETFGRMVRYLMLYSRDGTLPGLTGLEAVIFQRMKMQEDRYKESYDNLSSTRSAAGKAGAATRWNDGGNSKRKAKHSNSSDPIANDSKNGKAIASDSKAMASDSKAIASDSKAMASDSKAMASDSKNGNTETETDTDPLATNVAGGEREKRRSRFSPPTRIEVAEYCAQHGYRVDPKRFCNHYESNGWKVGRNPMKDWKAAVRNWDMREGGSTASRETDNQRYSRQLQELIEADAMGGEGLDPWGSGEAAGGY